ncbi:SRPBCC family protein [Microbulbifer thermotolerans]|uniref:Polyketide cyclase / dehydrase and lipid transport n=1 Tax=Microbulbifer thermotolerans TaxID=252514 RepID=A0A143HKE9_MICTH|nr:SRPBCC family protein [Microbulbifer thermotolerans]AMX02205.1 hypothetical protein A3224_06065 [Microbulbifer thermotolerans]MCX2778821.1 SRPBCC family protein [Microbulbifer thermotolerans]MCX2793707.1 SRPBCC family protein [Microbulbifer thermotolerans]MCX2804126.1 SRPBCC family protein [Microbulbifer thermotolerans]MCX2830254.1 SRPBCC family protein [Microbulbifer thermotolerans]
MRWILYILIFLALLVLAGFLFPREVTLERSVYITKPPQVVFPYVNNLRNFNSWSPWYHLDPSARYEYSGPSEGVGAVMRWRGDNPNMGSGAQTIISSEPYSLVRTQLDFGEQGAATAEFRLQPQGSGTNITWYFSTDMGGGPVARWMGLLVKRMVSESYQRGLENLKNVVESGTPAPSESLDEGTDTELPPENGGTMDTNPPGADPGMEGQSPDVEREEPIEENP